MRKAIQAGIDVRHCGICGKYIRCIRVFNLEMEDKRTGEKKLVSRRIAMAGIKEQDLDKAAYASGCGFYRPDHYLCNRVLNSLRNLPIWEWKKD